MQDFFSQIDNRIAMFDFSNLLNADYLFNTKPGPSEFINWAFLIAFIILIVSTLTFLTIRRVKRLDGVTKVLIRHMARRMTLLAIILESLVYFRSQGLTFLSMRFLVLVVVVLMLVNLCYFVFKFGRRIPKTDRPKVETSGDYQKYLPKKKKKN